MADVSRLPGPNTDFWDWQMNAACRSMDSDVFFHPEGERGTARAQRIANAKSICMSCPVRVACAEHAVRVREPYGIWGGLSEEDREAIYAGDKVADTEVAELQTA